MLQNCEKDVWSKRETQRLVNVDAAGNWWLVMMMMVKGREAEAMRTKTAYVNATIVKKI